MLAIWEPESFRASPFSVRLERVVIRTARDVVHMRNHLGLDAMLRPLLAFLLLACPAAAETFSPAPVPGNEMQMPSAPGGQSAMEVMPAFFPPWSPGFQRRVPSRFGQRGSG